ncbi:MAG: histidine kinase N-terminal 7TM domain-containing protein [Lentisphaeria bacterium]
MGLRVGVDLAYLLAAVLTALTGGLAWQRRTRRGAWPLAGLMAGVAWWALLALVESWSGVPQWKLRTSQIQYLGVVAAAPCWFFFAWNVARVRWRLPGWLVAAIWGFSGLTVLAAWSNGWHHWVWRNIEIAGDGSGLAVYRYGPWFWALLGVDYLLLAAGTLTLVVASRRFLTGYRRHFAALLAGVALPWAGSILYAFKLGPHPGIDWTVLGMAAGSLILAWRIWGQGLLDIRPMAHDALIASLADGMLVLDRRGAPLECNPAACRLLGLAAGASTPQVGKALAQEAALQPLLVGALPTAGEVAVERGGGQLWLDVRKDPVVDEWGEPLGSVVMLRDVTERKQADAERDRLLADLAAARFTVRTLEGLMPICGHCKRVRDDSGYWRQIEAYVSAHSEIQFTHGICPECAARHYPEVAGPETGS